MKIDFESYCKEEDIGYLLEEWNVEKNGALRPKDVAKSGRTEVWWKCPKCNYEWKTQVASRAIGKTRCPECYRRRQSEKSLAKKH